MPAIFREGMFCGRPSLDGRTAVLLGRRRRWPAFSLGCYTSSLPVTSVFKVSNTTMSPTQGTFFQKATLQSRNEISHFQKQELTGFFCPSVICSKGACSQRGLEGRAPLGFRPGRPGAAPHRLCDFGPSLSELLLLSLRCRQRGSHYCVLTSVSNGSWFRRSALGVGRLLRDKTEQPLHC